VSTHDAAQESKRKNRHEGQKNLRAGNLNRIAPVSYEAISQTTPNP
jgi:hypothetical protein